MLKFIKIIHTIIWAINASAILYILYDGIMKTFGPLLSISLVLVIIEVTVLVANKFVCPLTPWAAKYTTERQNNFDIYLPEWLAKYNKIIFGILLVVGIILTTVNILK